MRTLIWWIIVTTLVCQWYTDVTFVASNSAKPNVKYIQCLQQELIPNVIPFEFDHSAVYICLMLVLYDA
jgi:hypothetical protein